MRHALLVGLFCLAGVLPVWAQDAAPDCMPKPIASTHIPPPYPYIAARLSEYGKTELKVQLGQDGVPTGASVTQFSGWPRLDEAAEDYVKKAYRRQPLDPACRDVSTLVDVVWSLRSSTAPNSDVLLIRAGHDDFPPNAAANHEEGIIDLQVIVDSKGTLTQTRITRSSGFPDLDSAAMRMVTQRKFSPASIDGQTVPSGMNVSIAFAPENAGK